jgi:hypothetical protein
MLNPGYKPVNRRQIFKKAHFETSKEIDDKNKNIG